MYVIINENENVKNFVIDCRDALGTDDMGEHNIGAYVQAISKEFALSKEDEKTNSALIEKLKMGSVGNIKKHFKNIIGILREGNPGYALTLERFLQNLVKVCKDVKIFVVAEDKKQINVGSPLWQESTQIVQIKWYGENNIVDIKDWGIMPLKTAKERLKDNFIQAATHDELSVKVDTDLLADKF